MATKTKEKPAIELGTLTEPNFREPNITIGEPNDEGVVKVKIDPFMFGNLSKDDVDTVKKVTKFFRQYSEKVTELGEDISTDTFKKNKKAKKLEIQNSDRALKMKVSSYREKEQRVGAIGDGKTEVKPYMSVNVKTTSEVFARQSYIKEKRASLVDALM